MAAVFEGQPNRARIMLGPVERAIHAACRVDEHRQMTWGEYLLAVVVFSVVSAAALLAMLLSQRVLPLNPQAFSGMSPLLALNTAIRFMTTTDWQAYSGESAAVAVAAIRGLTRSNGTTLGNFGLMSRVRGCTCVEGASQTITGGPIASQEIIKQLGVNGGGFVGANSVSPNENPTPLTDVLQCLAMFLIGADLTNTFGRLGGDVRQGWTLYAVMCVLFAGGFAAVWGAEHERETANPSFRRRNASVQTWAAAAV